MMKLSLPVTIVIGLHHWIQHSDLQKPNLGVIGQCRFRGFKIAHTCLTIPPTQRFDCWVLNSTEFSCLCCPNMKVMSILNWWYSYHKKSWSNFSNNYCFVIIFLLCRTKSIPIFLSHLKLSFWEHQQERGAKWVSSEFICIHAWIDLFDTFSRA